MYVCLSCVCLCVCALMQLLSTPGAVEQLAKATTAHPATEHALCACVYALVCPPHTPHAAPAGADGAGAGAAAVVGALPDIEWEAGCAAVHQGQEVLAEAGMLPRLVSVCLAYKVLHTALLVWAHDCEHMLPRLVSVCCVCTAQPVRYTKRPVHSTCTALSGTRMRPNAPQCARALRKHA